VSTPNESGHGNETHAIRDAWGITELRISVKAKANPGEADITVLVNPTQERVTDIRSENGREVEAIGDNAYEMPQWLFNLIASWMTDGVNHSPLHDIPVCKTPGCRNRHLVHQH
jgi:hypothetical protein